MRSYFLDLRRYPFLRFLAPDTGAGGGAPSGAAASSPGTAAQPTPVDESLLDELPGGEMLRGATEIKPVETEAQEWNQEDDEEAGDSQQPVAEEKKEGGEKDEDEDKEKEEEVVESTAIPEDWPEAARSRVTELSAEKDALAKTNEDLTTKVADLEGKVASGPAPILAPTRSNPLSTVRDVRGLEVNEQFAQRLKSWAFRASRDGGEMPADLQAALEGTTADKITEARTITADEAHDLHEQAEAMLSQHIPARRRYLDEETAAQSELQRLAPEMLKTDSDEGKIYSAFLQQFPEAKLLSRWPTMLAATVLGHQILEQRAKGVKPGEKPAAPAAPEVKAKGGGKPTTPIAPVAPTPPSGGGAPTISKPRREAQLSASMDADELAATM